MSKILISIVIPVFNSADIVRELYSGICDSLKNIDFELILVNDASRDNSWEELKKLASVDSRVISIDMRINCGQDNAILAGLNHVNGDYVIVMDDDLQHDPADIPALIARCQDGYDVVFADFSERKHNIVKKSGSKFNGGVARWLLGKKKDIYLSPYKIFTRSLADDIAKFQGTYPYIDGIVLSLTSSIEQITVKHNKRYSGKSNYNIKKSAGVWFRLFTGYSVRPLKLMAMSGMIITFVAFILGLYYLYEYFFTDNEVEGWTTIVLLQILFSGIVITILGLIGIYIGRIFISLNGKQPYTIREIVRKSE